MKRRWLYASIGSFLVTFFLFITILLPAIDPKYSLLNIFKNEKIQEEEEPLSSLATVWYNPSWTYRKLLTLNTAYITTTRLVNFPILINITDADLASHAQSDGDDIFFVLYSDNTTKLNHEIEKYTSVTGQLFCWVNMTFISRTLNTKIWMYYGNSACGSQQNPTGTWNGGYMGVWHLCETTNPQYDSTVNNNDGTATVMTKGTNCKVDGGDRISDHSNTTQHIDCGTSNSLNSTAAITVEGWVNWMANNGGAQRLNDKYPAPSIYLNNDVTHFDVGWYGTIGGTSRDINTGVACAPSVWVYVAVTYGNDASHTITVYRNGTSAYTNNAYSGVLAGTTVHMGIGNRESDLGRGFYGYMDEVRLSNVVRNASWISTSYNVSQFSSVFVSKGDEGFLSWQTIWDPDSPVLTNGSIKNVTVWKQTVPPCGINGSIRNLTRWNVFSSLINGSIKNITGGSWTTFSTSINGSIKNISAWRTISTTINGSIKNVSTWITISSSLNGSIKNLTNWQTFSTNINGSIKNVSSWITISSSINGSIKNITAWQAISTNMNGSIKNISLSIWNVISSSLNGSIKNVTGWKVISASINGSIKNISGGITLISYYPLNAATGIPRNVTLRITIHEEAGLPMNITWRRDNHTTYLGSHIDVYNGTYYMLSNASLANHRYNWSINITNGVTWFNQSQWYQTGNTPAGGGSGGGYTNKRTTTYFVLGACMGTLTGGLVLNIWRKKKRQ